MVSFYRPKRLEDALVALNEKQWKIIAGGTDLLVKMKDRMIDPQAILDISGLEEMRYIEFEKGFIRIGGLTTHSDIESSVLLQTFARALVEGASVVGSPQIRNRGTIGGNLVNASPAGDTIPPLYVLDAEILVASIQGSRWIKIIDFFLGPGKTVILPNEILLEIRFKAREERFYSGFERLGSRKALAISKVSVAFSAVISNDGFLSDVRVSLGAVAPTVIRSHSAEVFLEGRSPSKELFTEASEKVMADAKPITDIRSNEEYRKAMCGVLFRRLAERIFQIK